jgi:hypothetical protein
MTSNKCPILYCCSLPDKHPRFSVKNGVLLPILAGAACHADATKKDLTQRGWLMDDHGNNISSVNSIFGDLTTLYWAWKNSSGSHLGVCQYRRSWDDEEVGQSAEDVLYIPEGQYFPEGSMQRQYEVWHGIFPAVEISRKLANERKIPLTVEMLDYAWTKGAFYGCNMVRGPRTAFDKFCELVFTTMIPFYNENIELCESLRGYNRRSIAFTAERMISALLVHRHYFFGSQKIKSARIHVIN